MTLLLSLLRIDALLCGTFAVLHGLEHLFSILLAHADLLLLLLLLVLILILVLVLILLVLVLLIFILVLIVLVLIFVLIFVVLILVLIVLILILVLVLVVFVLILVFVLLLLFELGQTQVVPCLLVIRVAAQGVFVELYRLVILVATVSNIP